ncbi:MAG: DUF6702 family protein [Ferruginibacter sp.]
MTGLLFKWLFIPFIWLSAVAKTDHHPIFVSVTEIEHNKEEKTLEISCKIFTDDFEKVLRNSYKSRVDLSEEKMKPAMEKLVNDYMQKHLQIAVDGKKAGLQFIGFEKIDEAIYSYFRADNIAAVKKIRITNDVLFEYKSQQMNLIHVTVGANRKSTKLSNPDKEAVLSF